MYRSPDGEDLESSDRKSGAKLLRSSVCNKHSICKHKGGCALGGIEPI